MKNAHTASIRERVKLPPSETMINSYYRPRLARSAQYSFQRDIWIHIAHARMLSRQKIISEADLHTLLAALVDLSDAGVAALEIDYSIEDIYSYIERYLIKVAGIEVGGRLHTGRSRNDLGVTSGRVLLREYMVQVLTSLNGLRETVLRQAAAYATTTMPGYTHWQHAQPITLGYYLLAFADQLERDWTRGLAALRTVNISPLGAGALAGTSFDLDRAFCADLLGFDGLMEVAYDAVSSRDDAHEACSAMAILMTALSRLCVDLQAWSTLEYQLVELGDQHSSVSSIMPQKKNPAALEHIKSQAAMVSGYLVAALSASKNTAFADVSDGVTGVDTPSVEAAVATKHVLDLMSDVVSNITVFPDRMEHLTRIGYGTATELADVLVKHTGMSFRKAHNIVALVVAEAIEQHRNADEISAEDLQRAAQKLFGNTLDLPAPLVAAALDPVENIRRRTSVGGPAPQSIAEMLARRNARLTEDADHIANIRRTLDDKQSRLLAEARSFVNQAHRR